MQPQAPGPNLPSMQPPQPNYDFIVNPAAPPKKPKFSFSGSSMLAKVIFVAIVLVVLMVAFTIFKAMTAKPNVSSYYVAVAQDQSLLTHIATQATQQSGASTVTLNSAVTVNASITSAQTELLAYMKTINAKATTKQLGLKVTPSVDSTLTNGATAGTYDTVYKTTMDAALATYMKDLKTAYSNTTGPKGKALLSAEFQSAELLVKQLN